MVAKKVWINVANPDAGIETVTKAAVEAADGSWHVDGLTLPLGGIWHVSVNALITDFTHETLEGLLVLRQ